MKSKFTMWAATALLLSTSAIAQQFTWKNGSDFADNWGSYGTIGVPSANNSPGGRELSASWMDASGNLWMFGGFGWDDSGNVDYLCDMWKYTVSTGQWTWVHGSSSAYVSGIYGTQGVASSANNPGGRAGCVTWTDASGNLWLFGGQGYDAYGNFDDMNDLWKYDISTNQWTWVSGSSYAGASGTYGTLNVPSSGNAPGARALCTGWQDASGNFWLFGGEGYDYSGTNSVLNDLWNYNPSTNQWTWINGYDTGGMPGSYGTQGSASFSNLPGARVTSTGWIDASNNLWLFGGIGIDASYNVDALNDLWMFSPATNQWTWMKGSNTAAQLGVYGTMGVAANSNNPSARVIPACWKDASGNFWLFGGQGYDAYGSDDNLNDLWKYSPASNQWTWVKGSNTAAQPGVYGTLGVSAATNMPGARYTGACWSGTASTSVWIFGGFGYDNTGYNGELSDLWSFGLCTSQNISITASANSLCAGSGATLTASGAASYSWSTSQTSNIITVTPSVTTSYTVTSTDANTCNNMVVFTETVYPSPSLAFSPASPSVCSGHTTQLSASGANTYIWVNDQDATVANGSNINFTPDATTNFTVSGTSVNGCSTTSLLTLQVAASPTVTAIQAHSVVCAGDLVQFNASGAGTYVWSNDQNGNTSTGAAYLSTPQVNTSYTVVGTNANGCSNSLSFLQNVTVCTGIKTNAPDAIVQVYPNPNNGAFTIKLNTVASSNNFILFNAVGQKVMEQSLTEETQIRHQLPQGVYYYTISQSGGSTASGKLIVE